MKPLVVVESPTKAKTISKFLGKEYNILASYGHIRDLPNGADEIPEDIKKDPKTKKWARLGINVEGDFEPLYIIPDKKKDQIKQLKQALKEADVLYLATDEDREGESISWHLVETLKPKVPTKRLVFHEITKEAIKHALENTREIDFSLVRAQETRRIIDRLFGYEVSPVLWKKMAPRLSAGRVQSVAVRLLVERERERIKFIAGDYWGIKAKLKSDSSGAGKDIDISAELNAIDGKRVATSKDFNPDTGKLTDPAKVILLDKDYALLITEQLKNSKLEIAEKDERPFKQSPSAPFVTSTLQQEGNRKLRFSAKRTMQIAQQLYENGFITYMRTDSTTLSEQAINAARSFIEKDYGKEYLPFSARKYQTKVKNAQEAHEAIRPAGDNFTAPEVVRKQLGEDAYKLYDIIWKRTVASQMIDAEGYYTNLVIEGQFEDSTGSRKKAQFRASGKTITQPGFLRAYVEGSDDPEADLLDQDRPLPNVKLNELLIPSRLLPEEHTTQPPNRFTEGSLIKELERLGIGRPSTWASIVELVLSRDYAFKKGSALVPTFKAIAVIGLLEKHFPKLVNYDFTAKLEDDLDAISRGEAGYLDYLNRFYHGTSKSDPNNLESNIGLHDLVKTGEADIDPRLVCGVEIGEENDKKIEVRIGKFGPFLSDGENKSSIPDELPPDELTLVRAREILDVAKIGPESLGKDQVSGLDVYVKSGRFGPYIQLGEAGAVEGEKPKMASIVPGVKPEEVTLDLALKILSLPYAIGANPENGEEIFLNNGRYGPYLKCGSENRTIPNQEEGRTIFDISLDEAIEIMKMPPRRGGRAAPQKPTSLKELGERDGVTIKVLNGRYGPYVTDGTTNASLKKGTTVEEVTYDFALELIRERESKAPVKKRGAKKAKAPVKSSAKTSAKATSKTKAKTKKSDADKEEIDKTEAKKSEVIIKRKSKKEA